MRCLFAVLLGFALSLPLFGQYSYNYTLSMADNTPYCATLNCLTSIGGGVAEIKAAPDGTVYGLTSAHVLLTYTKATNWQNATTALQTAGGYPIIHISVGSKSEVLALNSAPTTTPNVYVLNSAGTAWQSLQGWLSLAEVGADGSVWGINFNDALIFRWTGSAWVSVPGGLNNIAVASSGNVWGVNIYNQLFVYVGGSTVWTSIALPFTPSHAENAIAAAGETSLALLDTAGGIHVSSDAGKTWSTIQGTANAIAGAGTTMFTRDSSGVSYHVNLLVPAVTTTGTGTYATSPFCSHPPGCLGYTHTMTVNAKFGGLGGAHGTAGATNWASGAPPTNFNLPVTEYGSYCDPFFGDPSDPSCGITWSGIASCWAMGALGGSGGSTLPFFGTASTLVKNLSGSAGYNCSQHGGVTNCWWNTAPNCANTSSPTWAPPSICDSPPGIAGWWSIAGCVRAGTSQPWLCFAKPGSALKTTQTTPGNCTEP